MHLFMFKHLYNVRQILHFLTSLDISLNNLIHTHTLEISLYADRVHLNQTPDSLLRSDRVPWKFNSLKDVV